MKNFTVKSSLLLSWLTLAFFFLGASNTWAERQTTYLHTNGLGSVVAASDENGDLLWRKAYAPFGTQIDTDIESETTAYTGKQHDTDTGLTYFGARHYDPQLGRFMGLDPVGFVESNPTTFNRYAYVENNPYKYVDPDGEFLNFAAKFVLDVGVNVAFNYVTTGELNVGGALKESAVGVLNPAKTFQKAGKLANALKKSRKAKGSCCFVAGTQVLTESGYKNIEDVALGELLWAKNTDTGEQDWKPVTKIWEEPGRGIFEITLTDSTGFVQTIEATDDHPFYVVGQGWKTTIELAPGDLIETDQSEPMVVESVVDEQRTDLTYNFTVADFHTYYVTERDVLVHNCSLELDPSPFGNKVKGTPSQVKNAVNEAKVEKLLGDSRKAECAACKLKESIESRKKEQEFFRRSGQDTKSEVFKRHEDRINLEQTQLDNLTSN